ncbi:MAG: glycosyltransferase family 39 protein [Planctomycetota bacterium]|nr:glycosyltransferase family 39 protein [Planctomycetota bacterium]
MATSPQKSGWPAAIAVALAVALVYFFVATRTTLFDRDEPRFSSAAAEMVRSGNYLFPTFNGKLRPDKPILIYWLMSPCVKALGAVEAAVRLPSVLAAGGTALLVFWLGRRLFDAATGLIAAGILAATPLMLMIGTAATADSVLLFTLTACFCIWADAFLRGQSMSPTHFILLGLGLGAAQLTKGPGLRGPAIATLIGITLFLAWAVPANNATDGEFLRLGLGHHVLDRIATPQENHGGNWFLTLPYYLPILVLMFFPWTLFLLGSGSAVLSGRVGQPRVRALLVGWIVPTFVLMSVVSTKLPHYILPIFPALAIAVAATLRAAAAEGLSKLDRTLLHRGGMLFTPILVGGVVAAGAMWFIPASLILRWPGLELVVQALRLPAAGLACVALLFALPALALHLRWRFVAAARVAGLGMAAFALALGLLFLPAVEALKPSAALATAIRTHSAAGVPVASCDYAEPSLNFYVNRPPIEYLSVKEVEAWSHRPGEGMLVISRLDLDAVRKASGSIALEEVGHATGLSNSQLKPLDLLVVQRRQSDAVASPFNDLN